VYKACLQIILSEYVDSTQQTNNLSTGQPTWQNITYEHGMNGQTEIGKGRSFKGLPATKFMAPQRPVQPPC
jgi:hypothetical protein